jgi:hypothetical protein
MSLYIHMRRLSTEFRRDLFESVVKAVANAGFSPLIRDSLSAIQRTLRLEDFPRPEARPKRGLVSFISPSGILEGEMFLGKSDDEIFYLRVENVSETTDQKGASTFVSISWHSYLEAGAITRLEGSTTLDDLCAIIVKFAGQKISGPDDLPTFHSLGWTNAKFKELRSTATAASYQFSEEEKRLASELRFRPLRNLAITVKASGGMLIKDVRLAARREGWEELADRLVTLGLARREFVVICKRSSQQIIRLRDAEMIADLEKQGVLCSCGRHLKEENVEEILTPSDAIKSLLDGGKWLGAVLLSELENLGISTENALMNFQQGAEEVDAFFEVEGKLVLAELKDKEFSLGHAYPFAGRIGIFKPDYALILSTEQIARDVYDHFTKVEPQSKLFYAANLDELPQTLDRLVTEVRTVRALDLLGEFDNLPVLKFKFGGLVGSKIGVQPAQSEPKVQSVASFGS